MDDFQAELASRGIEWVTLPDGRRVARDKENTLLCPVCRADPDKMPDCSDCVGRGRVDSVPFADRPWDEVMPGLWVGGHDCQIAGAPPLGDCLPGDKFDSVISLYERRVRDFGTGVSTTDPRFEPAKGVLHVRHRMSDAELDPEHHTALDGLADLVVREVTRGRTVLVRCQAGLNRSGLVAALAMIKFGWKADDAIGEIRKRRSPYALFNEHFVEYLRSKDEA